MKLFKPMSENPDIHPIEPRTLAGDPGHGAPRVWLGLSGKFGFAAGQEDGDGRALVGG